MPRSTTQKHSTPVRFPNPMSGVRPIAANPSAPLATPIATPMPAVPAPSFGTIAKEGFAFGVGNAAAHRVFSSLFGPSQTVVVPSQPAVSQPCDKELAAFDACMKSRTIDEHCHEQQLSYTQCLRLTRGDSSAAPSH